MHPTTMKVTLTSIACPMVSLRLMEWVSTLLAALHSLIEPNTSCGSLPSAGLLHGCL